MKPINILAIGDIVGKPGREILRKKLPQLKEEYRIDFVIANGENAAHGFGITPEVCDELFFYNVNVVTTGNHLWHHKQIMSYIERERRLIKPANFPPSTMGSGYFLGKAGDVTVCVINLMGRVFMEAIDCPFRKFDELYASLKGSADLFIVDFHAEATSEKQAFGWYVDGRATAVFGTHTHVQTADETVLPGGTGYITDIGMTGSMESVIGMDRETAVRNFLEHTRYRLDVAAGVRMLNGAVFTVGENGRTTAVTRIRL